MCSQIRCNSPQLTLTEFLGYHFKDERVVVDGHFITSQGPGTSVEFALKIVEIVLGKDKAKKLKSQLLIL